MAVELSTLSQDDVMNLATEVSIIASMTVLDAHPDEKERLNIAATVLQMFAREYAHYPIRVRRCTVPITRWRGSDDTGQI